LSSVAVALFSRSPRARLRVRRESSHSTGLGEWHTPCRGSRIVPARLLQLLAAANRSDMPVPDWCCPPSCKRIATVLQSGEKRHDDFSDIGATGETRRARSCATPCKTTFGHAASATRSCVCERAMTNWSQPCDQPEQHHKSERSCAFARVPPVREWVRACSSSRKHLGTMRTRTRLDGRAL
jgi:hypothetical protein